jgi:hypothetical protein
MTDNGSDIPNKVWSTANSRDSCYHRDRLGRGGQSTAVAHLRYRGGDPTSEKRRPSQIRSNRFGRSIARPSGRLVLHALLLDLGGDASGQQLYELVMIHGMRKHAEIVSQRHLLRLLA